MTVVIDMIFFILASSTSGSVVEFSSSLECCHGKHPQDQQFRFEIKIKKYTFFIICISLDSFDNNIRKFELLNEYFARERHLSQQS